MGGELRVDWIRCDGYGLCGDLAPDAIALDEWRYPIILADGVPSALLNDVQRAIDCCPMRALSLVDSEPGGTRPRAARAVDGSSASI
jgi:ferredoxin